MGDEMKIGVIGSGKIGGTVGTLWAQAGHQVMFSSRHPDTLDALVARAGSNASRGMPEDAARFGDVVLISVPFNALPELGRSLAKVLSGKVVLETGNPYPQRDGEMAKTVIDAGRGTGPFVAQWFPGVRIVRAFNSVWAQTLAKEAHRPPPRVGIPLASDDRPALEVAAGLVRDAGFDPVIVGGLDRAKSFDIGTPVYNTGMSGPDLRKALGITEQPKGPGQAGAEARP
jgi:8-hydroxy-5-deazaflavin:NADPH oxidoreductase